MEIMANTDEAEMNRVSSLINAAEVRRQLIERARAESYYWREIVKNPRVSQETLNLCEAATAAWLRNYVLNLPHRGKTI